MRDLIDLVQTVTEGSNLAPSEFQNRPKRWVTFIEKIKTKSPFTTTSGKKVVIDPSEASRFMSLYKNNKFNGPLKARLIPGSEEDEIALSKLAKTTEFGGGAADAGAPKSAAGKEGLLVKPTQIGIVDYNIPASDLYETITTNPVLNSTDYGKVVIELASYIRAGEYVMMPEEYQQKDKEPIRKAIVDYAGEYLGVLALLYGRSRFPAKARFLEWLGGSTDDLVLNFPAKSNMALADSFAMITNPDTNHTLNISSKGGGGGAPPAISGLKIPEHVRTNPKYTTVVKFIEICQDEGTIDQAFSAMDLIYKTNPKSLPKKWIPYLPFSVKSPKLKDLATESWLDSRNKIDTPLPKKYRPLYEDIKGTSSEGGKLIYAIKKTVAQAVNDNNAIPEFATVVLETLEMNFIQQYTDYKSGELVFATQWPAKLDGKVTIENKSSASEPKAGGFSFKLGRTDSSVSSEPGEDPIDGEAEPDNEPILSEPEAEKSFHQGAAAAANPSMNREKPRDSGRQKRK